MEKGTLGADVFFVFFSDNMANKTILDSDISSIFQ